MQFRVGRVKQHGLMVVLESQIDAACPCVQCSAISKSIEVVGRKVDRLLERTVCILHTAQITERIAHVVERHWEVGLKRNRLLVGDDRLLVFF